MVIPKLSYVSNRNVSHYSLDCTCTSMNLKTVILRVTVSVIVTNNGTIIEYLTFYVLSNFASVRLY